MLKDITLGQYFPGNSVVHRLDPRTKLIMLVVYIVALFCAVSWVSYAVVLAFLAVTIAVSKIPLKSLVEELEQSGQDYRILILPDHPTPIRIRTHSSGPVPYLLYDNRKKLGGQENYSEETAEKSGLVWKDGYQLMDHLLED